jgi:hypothetical protein
LLFDLIFEANKKIWATARIMRDLLNAFSDLFLIQANRRGVKGKALKLRIATVGKTERPLKDAA